MEHGGHADEPNFVIRSRPVPQSGHELVSQRLLMSHLMSHLVKTPKRCLSLSLERRLEIVSGFRRRMIGRNDATLIIIFGAAPRIENR